MKKTSVKARMLVEKSPFVTSDGVIFTGEKTSRLFGVDLSNGQLLGEEYDENNHNIINDEENQSTSTDKSSTSSSMWLGRIDYTVRAFDGETGREKVSSMNKKI